MVLSSPFLRFFCVKITKFFFIFNDVMTTPVLKHHTFKDKLIAWLHLTRFDKPIGTELLLYPTLWALFLANAAHGSNRLKLSVKAEIVFFIGHPF